MEWVCIKWNKQNRKMGATRPHSCDAKPDSCISSSDHSLLIGMGVWRNGKRWLDLLMRSPGRAAPHWTSWICRMEGADKSECSIWPYNQHLLFCSGIIQSVNLTFLWTQKPAPEPSCHTPTCLEPWELGHSLGFLLIFLTHVPELCWSPWVVLMARGERATLQLVDVTFVKAGVPSSSPASGALNSCGIK